LDWWWIASFSLIVLIALMVVSARKGIFPRSMVLRSPADAKLAAMSANVVNLGMPAIFVSVVIFAHGEAALITGLLAVFVAIDVAYYIWVCHKNV
jgi:protein-S-isoprenylcysteine O-methyltransferase Ste14